MRSAMRIIPLCVLVCMALSCRPRSEDADPTIQYVRDILSDKSGPEMTMLSRLGEPDPSDDIALIGTSTVCDRFVELMSSYDMRDNVDGSHKRDGLPDFAGETFSCIAEESSFRRLVSGGGTDELRRQAIFRVLAALDTSLHISPYDMEGHDSKKSSKMIVLADPYLAHFASSDADTLLKSAGCGVPVISPLDIMLDKVFSSHPDRPLSVGILYNPDVADAGVYLGSFKEGASARAVKGSVCTLFATDGYEGLVRRLLSVHGASEGARPLDFIVVDDPSVDMEVLKNELAEIVSVMNESSVTYGRMLADDFQMLDFMDTAAQYCYDVLRRQNLFTHNIALPQYNMYRPVVRPDSEDGSIMLISASYVSD